MKDDRLVAMRVFQAVAETGGFTTAAQALGVSQPFVSQTIQRLEARLQVKLLHRTTRGHRLTREGERFVASCRGAIEAVERAEADLAQDEAQIGGPLRVSAPLAFGLDRVTPLLPGFLDTYPNITLDLLLTDDSVNLIEDRIDIAIRMGQLSDSTLLSRRLCGLSRVVVAAPSLIERHGRPRAPDDLADFPVLSWDGSREPLNRWNFRVGGETRTFVAEGRFRSNEGMSLFKMCLAGFGVMRCAEHLARPAIRDGALVSLLDDYVMSDDNAFYAVFLPDRHMLPRMRAFLDFTIEAFRAPEW